MTTILIKDNDTNESIAILTNLSQSEWLQPHTRTRLKRAIESHYDANVEQIDVKAEFIPKYKPVECIVTLEDTEQPINLQLEKVWEF